jgi:hypothetical protein
MQWAKNPTVLYVFYSWKYHNIKAFTAISFSYFLSHLYMNEGGAQARPCPVWIWRSFFVVKLSILGWRSLLGVICQQASFQEEPSDSEGGICCELTMEQKKQQLWWREDLNVCTLEQRETLWQRWNL